ncbi:grsT [Symbiodinium natans]|uniref:GrsT protein n=1 Tax=Symbiodinium natans TaxID=878477 RepID=A0A812J6W0_9DINO|nr:grsT [Symbiodinium natans]
MDIVDFVLPPPAIPVDEKLTQVDTPVPNVSEDAPTWSSNARLPQLRIRTFRMSPYLSPQMSPKTPEKHRRRTSRALDDTAMTPITRAQLREGATGVEDVLNRVRYDLLECTEAASFTVLVENSELPDLCRHHLLRGECRYGQHCPAPQTVRSQIIDDNILELQVGAF